ncbi:cell division protein PerM [Streptomyces hypolithicus]
MAGVTQDNDRRRSSVRAACFVRGVIAAGLGLGSLTVLALALWISSPYRDSGLGGALNVAAGLWLLAHGAELVRYDTLSGVPAPVGVTPMLLMVLPLWLTHRAARDALEPDGDGDGEGQVPPSSRAAFVGVAGGYLFVGAAALLYVSRGALRGELLSAALWMPLVVVSAAGAGVWTANGRPRGPLPGWVPGGVRRAVVRPRFRVALAAAGAGVVALLAGGVLLALGSLVWHAGSAHGAFSQLAGAWSGRFAVLLLGLVLAPNAAVWGAAYGLGPGFALGAGATATPLAAAGAPALPHFPLLAALPVGGGTPISWVVLVVPVAGAVGVAWFTVRAAAPAFALRDEAWGAKETALTAALGGVGCAGALTVLTLPAGGALGVGALSEFGPVWWRTGGAALAWMVALGVPGALALRAWRLRARRRVLSGLSWAWRRTPGEGVAAGERTQRGRWRWPWRGRGDAVPDTDGLPPAAGSVPGDLFSDWHESGAREVRWAAIREASGGLMASIVEGSDHPDLPVAGPREAGGATVDANVTGGAGERAADEPGDPDPAADASSDPDSAAARPRTGSV